MSRKPSNGKPSYPFGASNAISSSSNPRSSPLNPQAQGRPQPSPSASAASSRTYLPTSGNAVSTTNLLSPPTSSSLTPRAGPGSRLAGGAGGLSSPSSASLITPYTSSPSSSSIAPSISDKFSLSADPSAWGSDLSPGHAEPDDYLHNPDPRRDRKNDQGGTIFTARGLANLGCLALLGTALVMLFAGYPLLSHFIQPKARTLGGYNLGGTNATGQVPEMSNHVGLIDPETPSSALHFTTYADKSKWDLIFSDEFNTEGRTFYPGDDPYWEAVDLHYWQTNDLEWYDPEAVTTTNGYLKIQLNQTPSHELDYVGGHLSSWNKFCFTGGYVEVNVSLPGEPQYAGLWPAIWMMGNLGRAGYGASLEGTWPYSYDSCDVGTVANQTINGKPVAATKNGDKSHGGALSYLPGQRLSACTCPGESHPGPTRSDGTFVGRSAPEIDMFEATSADGIGQVSQSCQFAPFDEAYGWANTTADAVVYDSTVTKLNSYRGGIFQEATSALSNTDQTAYFDLNPTNPKFSVYGVEYKPGLDGYITWISNGKAVWTMNPSAVGPDAAVNISSRVVPQEPMYMIMNLGISHAFGAISDALTFPTSMLVDYIRIYQDPGNRNVGCDPSTFPTENYINQYIEAYSNPNLTTWVDDFKQPFPKNRLLESCS